MKIKISANMVIGTVLIAVTSLIAEEPAKIKRIPAHPTLSIAGQDLFREYCAVCHGSDGKGVGPAAAALKVKPADLTAISQKNGGKYPEVRVQRVINGEDEITVHGTRDMPMWGQIFRHMGSNQDQGAVRVYNLVKYIEQIQAR